jgi:hypothetical protein
MRAVFIVGSVLATLGIGIALFSAPVHREEHLAVAADAPHRPRRRVVANRQRAGGGGVRRGAGRAPHPATARAW